MGLKVATLRFFLADVQDNAEIFLLHGCGRIHLECEGREIEAGSGAITHGKLAVIHLGFRL